jgi:hypothetical protein
MAATAELTVKLIGQDMLSGMFRHATGSLKSFGAAVTAPIKGVATLAAVGVKGLGAIGLAGMGLEAVGGAAKGLAGALGIGLNAELEILRAQFLAITKDAAGTDKMLASFQTRADKSPFGLTEVAKAGAMLLPAAKQAKMGLDPLLDTAELLAALNPAEGLEGAAFSLREALSGDFVSIVERFNLPRKRLNELKKQGVPAIEAINRVLKEMGIDSSIVAAMGETLTGRWSTLDDTLKGIRRTLSAGLFDELKRAIVIVQGLLDTNKDAINAWAKTWSARIGAAAAVVIDGVGTIMTALMDLRTFIATGDLSEASVFAPFVTSLGIARDAALTFIGAIKGDWAGAATTSIDPSVRSVGQLGTFLRTYVIPSVIAFGQLFRSILTGDVGGALNALYEIIIGSRLRVAQAFLSWIAPIIPPLMAELGKLGQSIMSWVAAQTPAFVEHFLTTWAPAFVGWLATAGEAALPHLTAFLDRITAWVEANGAPMLEAFIAHWTPQFVNWLGSAAQQIIPRLLQFQAEIVKWVATEGVPAMIQIGLDLGGAIVMGIIQALQGVTDKIRAALIQAGVPLPNSGLGAAIPPGVTQRPPVTATSEHQQALNNFVLKAKEAAAAMDNIVRVSNGNVDRAYAIMTDWMATT